MSDETSVAEATTTTAAQPDLTPDELIAAMESSFRDFKDGDIVEGDVVKIDRDEVLLDIGYKSEGVIPSKELSIRHDVKPAEVVQVGEHLEALVLQKEDKEGRPDPVQEARAVRARVGPDRGDDAVGPDDQGPGDRGRQGRPDPGHRPARVPACVARRSATGPRSAAVRRHRARVQDHRARPQPQQRGAQSAAPSWRSRSPKDARPSCRTSRRGSGARARSARS